MWIKSREVASSVDVELVQEPLLFEVGEVREGHVVASIELGVAVIVKGTVTTLAVPIGFGRECATKASPLVVCVEQFATLREECVVRGEVESGMSIATQLEPPHLSLAIDHRDACERITVAQRRQYSRGVGERDAATRERQTRAHRDARARGGEGRRELIEGRHEQVASTRRLDHFGVLDDDGRVDETLVVSPEAKECVRRRPSMPRDVIGESWLHDEFDAFKQRTRCLGG